VSQTYIPAALRREVRDRAQSRCEYCLYPEAFAFVSYCIDHIISEKHGGKTVSENLAYSCADCNLQKGSDLASLDPTDGALVRLFNPRVDAWSEHFRLDDATMEPLTPVGRVTVQLLKLNDAERIRERQELVDLQSI
jgi:hypothetical protein